MKNTTKSTTTYPRFAPEFERNSINVKLRDLYRSFGVYNLEFEKPDVIGLVNTHYKGALSCLAELVVPPKGRLLAICSSGFVTSVSDRVSAQLAEVHVPIFCTLRHLYKGMIKLNLAWPVTEQAPIQPHSLIRLDLPVLVQANSDGAHYWISQPEVAEEPNWINPFHYAQLVLPESLPQPGSKVKISTQGVCEILAEVLRSLQPCDRQLYCDIMIHENRFKRFLLYSASARQHHNTDHGLLVHTAETVGNLLLNAPNHIAAQKTVQKQPQPSKPDLSLALLAALLHDAAKVEDYYRLASNVYSTNLNCELVGHEQTMMKWIAVACAISDAYPKDRQLHLEHAICAVKKQHDQSGVRKRKTAESFMLHEADCKSARNNGMGELSCLISGGWVKGV